LKRVEERSIELVKLLFENKDIDINARDFEGRTSLLNAVAGREIKIAKSLLKDKDIDINTRNSRVRIALLNAVE
jgi:ankyrin repeat protein